MTVGPVVPICAFEQFAYFPRQCALIHCDGIWSDNAHTVTRNRKHRRVDSGRHRRERGREVLRSIPLWSETLGLTGRAGAVEMTDGAARLRRIGDICGKYGQRVQYSVFECRLSANRLARMKGEIEDAIDKERDSVIVYCFPGRIQDSTFRLGRDRGHRLGQPWVL